MNTLLFNVAFYFFIFIDDYFKYTHIYFLHKKFEALTCFTQYGSMCNKEPKRASDVKHDYGSQNHFIFSLLSFETIIIMGS
jgi:hypothetical protein